MALRDLAYEPDARNGQVAAAVNGKLYLWGGLRRHLPKDGPDKNALMSVVDILDLQVCYASGG